MRNVKINERGKDRKGSRERARARSLVSAMTNAERQARYRAAHGDGSPKVRYRRPGDRRSRPQCWRDAVDSSGRMIFGIFATLAELERDLIRAGRSPTAASITGQTRSIGPTAGSKPPITAPTPPSNASLTLWQPLEF